MCCLGFSLSVLMKDYIFKEEHLFGKKIKCRSIHSCLNTCVHFSTKTVWKCEETPSFIPASSFSTLPLLEALFVVVTNDKPRQSSIATIPYTVGASEGRGVLSSRLPPSSPFSLFFFFRYRLPLLSIFLGC